MALMNNAHWFPRQVIIATKSDLVNGVLGGKILNWPVRGGRNRRWLEGEAPTYYFGFGYMNSFIRMIERMGDIRTDLLDC
jgi:hypothetical protein